jgi:taurine dioxygenase
MYAAYEGLSDEVKAEIDGKVALHDFAPFQCRFRWSDNAIAFWDNRASQHYAASDYWPAVRRMERVTVVGDRPV